MILKTNSEIKEFLQDNKMNGNSGDKLLLAKAEDVINLSEKHHSLKHTDFLTPGEAQTIKNHFLSGVMSKQEFFGGYDDAERVMFISYPDYKCEYEPDEILCALIITGREVASLNHRDYLGSLLGLGIKREKIGDILVSEDETIVFLSSDIADYVQNNLTKIGRCGIKLERKNISDIKAPEKKTETISGTVQSVRFDAVLSTALKISRGKASQLIEGEKASVNWNICTSCKYIVKEGDVFSVRGYGRFKLESAGGLTRKGRINIEILKYV